MHAKFFATLSIAVITAFTITVIYSVKSNSEDPELIKLLMLKSDAYAKYPTTDEELIKDKEFDDGYSNEQNDASDEIPSTVEELIKDPKFDDGKKNVKMYQCEENPKITAICYGSDINA